MEAINKKNVLPHLAHIENPKILEINGRVVTYGPQVKSPCLAKIGAVALFVLIYMIPLLCWSRSARDKREALSEGVTEIKRVVFDRSNTPNPPPDRPLTMGSIVVNAPQPLPYEVRVQKMQEATCVMRGWAKAQKWGTFHDKHYDWFAFPSDIKRKSSGCDWAFSWTQSEIDILKEDTDAVKSFRESVTLYFRACGWDVSVTQAIPCMNGMRHEAYQVRLGKILLACKNLEQMDLYNSGRAYVENFIQKVTDPALKIAMN